MPVTAHSVLARAPARACARGSPNRSPGALRPSPGERRLRYPREGRTIEDASLADFFSVQQAGADRTRPGLQLGEVADAALAAEVIGRVHHGLDPQRPAVLQVLLHAGMAPEGVDGHAVAAAVDRGLERPAGLVLGFAAPRVAL